MFSKVNAGKTKHKLIFKSYLLLLFKLINRHCRRIDALA